MKCDEFQQTLKSLVEARESANCVDLAQHAALCSCCHDQWEEFQMLEMAICAWRSSPCAVETPKATRGRLVPGSASTINPTRTARSRFSIAGASAVLLLVGLVAFWSFAGVHSEDVQVTQHAIVPSAFARPVPLESSGEDVTELSAGQAADAASTYVALAQNATQSVGEMVVLLLPQGEPSTSLAPHEATPVDESRPAWLDRWGHTLSPIGKNVEHAVEKFLETFPGTSTPTTLQLRRPPSGLDSIA